ncbi:MAG TPA: cytochrome c3 family protein [Anaeromyxobacteraceae bacterium]|nr:cytochrome c3 family protein [Anaeromyxobacteraceae bacterium]
MIRMLSVALAACLFAAPVLAAEPPKGPVTIKAPEGAKQPAVKFDHAKHAKVDCAKCHADKANEKAVPAVASVKAGDASPKSASHELCLTCHKENKAKATCVACHAKG